MSIYRGTGGSSTTTDETTINAVNQKAAEAATSATNAASSASSASTSASNSATSASQAATSATNAATSASQALQSKNTAATSATAASAAQVAAESAQAAAESAKDTAVTYGSNAVSANTTAQEAKTAAETARDVTLGYRDEAEAFRDQAAASASTASAAEVYATNASNSADEAAASALAAQAALDAMEGVYIGSNASAPTTDGNGDALTVGDWYYNTTDNQAYIWNGASWDALAPDLVGDTTPQLGGDLDVNGHLVAGRDIATDGTKLDGIEAGADVTDTANVTAAGALMTTGGSVTGNINFGDNDKAIFGAGSDLQIYHDGSNSYVKDAGTGSLYVQGSHMFLTDADGNEYLRLSDQGTGGTVYIKHDGSTKLTTTSTGIDVAGTATMDGLTVDGTTTTEINGTDYTYSGTNYDVHALIGTTGGGVRLGQDSVTRHGFIGTTGSNNLDIVTYNGTAWGKRAAFAYNGDISFYEDTGTTAKFFWDASAERLGIGTSSPTNDLHISTVAGSARLTSTGGGANLFMDSAAGNSTRIRYTGASGNFSLRDDSAGVDRVSIDSSGNLLVGTTTAVSTGNDSTTNGLTFYNSGVLFASRANGGHYFNRNSSDGDIATFRKDGTTVGSIGGYNGDLTIGTGDTGIVFDDANDTLNPVSATAGNARDGALVLGGPFSRFKDLYLSGGVYLGGTGSANHLDDYESGTWTPTLSGSTGGSVSGVGTYTKTGNVVTVTIRIENQPTSGLSGSMLLNLPFSSSSSTGEQVVPINMHVGWSISGKMVGTFSNASTGFLRQMTDSAGWSVLGATGGNVYIRTVFTYTTD